MAGRGNTAGEVGVDVIPEMKDFGKRLANQMKPAIEDAGRRTRGLGDRLFSGFKAGFKGLARTAVIGFAGLTAGAVAYSKTAVDAFNESNEVGAQTAAVIESTGGAAAVTKKHIGDLASAIRDYSGIEDEAVQAGENMLLTFTNIRNEVDGKFTGTFDRATQILADLSVGLGTDMKSSAIQLGKALNDPVKGITALRRVGVAFNDDQKKQIETMVEAGNIAGAQGVILDELAKEFGGSAKAMGKANPAKILKSQIGDVQEVIGQSIQPIITSLLKVVGPVLEQLGPVLASFIVELGPVLGEVLKALSPVVKILAGAFKPILAALKPVIVALAPILAQIAEQFAEILISLTPLLPPLGELLVALAPLIPLILMIVNALVKLLVPALTFLIGWITKVVDAIVNWAEDWRDTWTQVKAIAKVVWDWLTNAVGAVRDAIVNAFNHTLDTIDVVFAGILDVIGFALGLLTQGFRGFIAFFLSFVGAFIHGAAVAFGWLPGIGGKLKTADAQFHDFKDSMLGALDEQIDKFNAWGDQVAGQLSRVEQAAIRAAQAAAGVVPPRSKGPGDRGHFQHGGVAEGLVTVGESGRELAWFDQPTLITPHRQTEAILAALDSDRPTKAIDLRTTTVIDLDGYQLARRQDRRRILLDPLGN